MKQFSLHTPESAPIAARPLLENTEKAFGFIPNLMAVMSTSPALTEAYLTLSSIFDKTDLSPTERQIVLLTVSHYHGCSYCMAAHSAIAEMQKVPEDVVKAIRENQPINNRKLQALRTLVVAIVEKRGWLDETDVESFIGAGYEASHVMDVLVGIAQKTLSNFTNHIAGTPLDKVFEPHAWKPGE